MLINLSKGLNTIRHKKHYFAVHRGRSAVLSGCKEIKTNLQLATARLILSHIAAYAK